MKTYLQIIEARKNEENIKEMYEMGLSLYKRAKNEKDYLHAAEYLDNAENYKDSKEFARICRNRAETMRKDCIYIKAKNYLEALDKEEILKAVPLLKSIPGYQDADELVKHIDETVSNAEIERKYQDAAWLQFKGGENELKDAAELFSSIAGWKDSDAKADECRRMLEKLKQQRKEAEEKKRLHIEEKKRQLEDRLEALQKEKASLGFFAKKRKQEIDAECADIIKQLKN